MLAKLAIAIGILYFLLVRGSIAFGSLLTTLVGNVPIALGCMGLLLAALLIGAVRWWLILRVAGIRLGYRQVASLTLIGSFFSTWLPGAAGGDAARALYLFRSLGQSRTTAVLTIVIDRVFALTGLLGAATLLMLVVWQQGDRHPVLTFYLSLCLGAIAVCMAGGLALFGMARFVKVTDWPYWLRKLRPFAHQLRETVVLVMGHWPAMLVCTLLSVLASAIVACGIALIGSAFSFGPPPMISALAGVVGNVSSAIPLSPGGLGIGEAVFAKVCLELGSTFAPYSTIYLAFRILMMLVSFSGGLVWLTYSAKRSDELPTTIKLTT
ncbi:flippase-like domain-containing protein [Ramlibacter sp. XY19]|uniref:lysylphosphatidylglycerol synthase transmembrane domain-containing protein n=1 Tax=Ramlibacter paludis TaxID=2908000 RepID=UPI0023DA6787|nr:lysylphosphatidylglycerol synthase transmembrane domain-containing protein [Ramlibacter paludis]MCG2595605.1 flippase-like domain-containing protein [Ramlibacter paludis]